MIFSTSEESVGEIEKDKIVKRRFLCFQDFQMNFSSYVDKVIIEYFGN